MTCIIASSAMPARSSSVRRSRRAPVSRRAVVGIGAVPDASDRAQQRVERDTAAVPAHACAPRGEIDVDLAHAGLTAEIALDKPGARGAVNAFEQERDGALAASVLFDQSRAVCRRGKPRRLVASGGFLSKRRVRRFAARIKLPESRSADGLRNRAASRTAKMPRLAFDDAVQDVRGVGAAALEARRDRIATWSCSRHCVDSWRSASMSSSFNDR